MLFSTLLAAVAAVGGTVATPIFKRDVNWSFGSNKVRGVNIGGWLVLEPFITPSIFQADYNKNGQIVGEWTLTQNLPYDQAKQILTTHWENWVSEDDFKRIKNTGFNLVRIPIGYWAFHKYNNDPYIQGAADYLDRAIGWARDAGLKVWIDLHGAPGSQNGFDNSGHRLNTPISPGEIGWGEGDTVNQTLEVLEIMSTRYLAQNNSDVVVALELLNEPLATSLPDVNILKQFYKDGYGEAKSANAQYGTDTTVVIHDAFEPSSFWNDVLSPSDAMNVVIDHHEYQVFTNDFVAMEPWQHRQLVCNNVNGYSSDSDHWVVVGEWSAAMTDCAPALNGWGIGARYEGYYPGSKAVSSCGQPNVKNTDFNNIANWSNYYKADTTKYIEAQIEVYEARTRGWVFWNFKTEAAHEWSLFALQDFGIWPSDMDHLPDMICS